VPESTLTLKVTDLQAEIGHYLGYGRGVSFNEGSWDVYQTNDIDAVMKSGLSMVYTPPPLSPKEPPHSWSFLRPIDTLTLISGQNTTLLPDGFGGFEEPLHIRNPATARVLHTLRLTQIARVEHMYSIEPTTTGAPRCAAEKVLPGTTALGSTRSALYVWPIPDTTYHLTGVWKHLPGMLTGSYPYHPGGAEHSQLFKYAVIAAAAIEKDDDPEPRNTAFMQKLAACVHADRKRKGQFLGYNADRSDNRQRVPRMPGWSRFYDNGSVTYDGEAL
jgi:hypothetical protein